MIHEHVDPNNDRTASKILRSRFWPPLLFNDATEVFHAAWTPPLHRSKGFPYRWALTVTCDVIKLATLTLALPSYCYLLVSAKTGSYPALSVNRCANSENIVSFDWCGPSQPLFRISIMEWSFARMASLFSKVFNSALCTHLYWFIKQTFSSKSDKIIRVEIRIENI